MTQQELDELRRLVEAITNREPLGLEEGASIIAAVPALLAEVERLAAAWHVEHDAYIRADERLRMAQRELTALRHAATAEEE